MYCSSRVFHQVLTLSLAYPMGSRVLASFQATGWTSDFRWSVSADVENSLGFPSHLSHQNPSKSNHQNPSKSINIHQHPSKSIKITSHSLGFSRFSLLPSSHQNPNPLQRWPFKDGNKSPPKDDRKIDLLTNSSTSTIMILLMNVDEWWLMLMNCDVDELDECWFCWPTLTNHIPPISPYFHA